MKHMNIEFDEALVAEGLRTTGIGSVQALFDYCLRELLGRDQIKCHCRFSEEPLCRFRWVHPEVAGFCRSGQKKDESGAPPTAVRA